MFGTILWICWANLNLCKLPNNGKYFSHLVILNFEVTIQKILESLKSKQNPYQSCSRAVWPDWRFLKVLGDTFSNKNSTNYLQLFGPFWKTSLLCKNCCGYFLGNHWKHLGYFLLQHLVTLFSSHYLLKICATDSFNCKDI